MQEVHLSDPDWIKEVVDPETGLTARESELLLHEQLAQKYRTGGERKMFYTDRVKEVVAKNIDNVKELVGKTIAPNGVYGWGDGTTLLIAFDDGSHAVWRVSESEYDDECSEIYLGSTIADDFDALKWVGLLTADEVKAEREAAWADSAKVREHRDREQYWRMKLKYERGIKQYCEVHPVGDTEYFGTVNRINIDDPMKDEPEITIQVGWPRGCDHTRIWSVSDLVAVTK